jgi:hypothetical protein
MNPVDYAAGPSGGGIVGGFMNMISDSNLEKRARKATAAIHAAAPEVSLETEIRSAFGCEANLPDSLCSEFAVLPDAATMKDQHGAVAQLLAERHWSDARVLNLWVEFKGARILVKAAIMEVKAAEGTELAWKQPVYASYRTLEPAAASTGAKNEANSDGVPRPDYWLTGSPSHISTELRAALRELEPLARHALSWGANNDAALFKPHFLALTMTRKLRKVGIECTDFYLCSTQAAGVVSDRLWAWWPVGDVSGSYELRQKIGDEIFMLQSDPLIHTGTSGAH